MQAGIHNEVRQEMFEDLKVKNHGTVSVFSALKTKKSINSGQMAGREPYGFESEQDHCGRAVLDSP